MSVKEEPGEGWCLSVIIIGRRIYHCEEPAGHEGPCRDTRYNPYDESFTVMSWFRAERSGGADGQVPQDEGSSG